MFSFCCVLVHSGNFMVWKQGFQFGFNLLGSKTFGVQGFAATSNATLHHSHMIAAIMTAQLIFMLMKRQANITVWALWRNPARGAFHYGRKTSSILKKNYLFTIF